jgi:hypothetical protein
MSVWDSLRRAFKRETRELEDVIADATERGNAALDEKERELNATPEERLLIEQQRAEQTDQEFEALKRKIEGNASGGGD